MGVERMDGPEQCRHGSRERPDEPAHDVEEQQTASQVNQQVAEMKAGPPQAVQVVVDRQRQVQQRSTVVRASSLGLGVEDSPERKQPPDRRVVDDRNLVIKYERPIQRVAVGTAQCHDHPHQ